MGRRAYDRLDTVRELFSRSSGLLGYDLARLCFEGPAEELDSTVRSQPALLVCSLAALELVKADSPQRAAACEAAAGLSLGEYTALVFAGAMEFEAALRVVRIRGESMQVASDAAPGGMVGILGMPLAQVQGICDLARREGEILRVANHLCPGNLVISGHLAACQRAGELAITEGAMKAVPLAVAGAFHTPLMQSAVQPLAEALQGISISKPRIPVISNVDARSHDDPEEIRQLLVRQVVSPVRWEDSMRWLVGAGFDTFIEVGPGRVLRSLLKRIHRDASCEGVEV
jgi:[acyl-carrier-protein] S-malonyltransferase